MFGMDVVPSSVEFDEYSALEEYSTLEQKVSESEYEYMHRQWPGIGKDPGHKRMLAHVATSNYRDEPSGLVVIDREIIAGFYGRMDDLRNNRYAAWKDLERFRQDVLPDFAYSDWDSRLDRARVVTRTGVSQEQMEGLMTAFRWGLEKEAGMVLVATGEWYTKYLEGKDQELLESRASFRVSNRLMVIHQNNHGMADYSRKINQNLDRALAVLDSLDGTVEQKLVRMRTLEQVTTYKKPWLHKVDNSDRVYAEGSPWTTLKREVRRELTRGWYSYDLRGAQLAIVAQLWDVPELAEVLSECLKGKQKVWHVLCDDIGVSYEMIDAVKLGVYRLVFGGSEGMAWRGIKRATGSAEVARRFVRSRLIKLVLEGRKRRIKQVMRDGGLSTCFDDRIEVPEGSRTEVAQAIRRMLAREAQAVETKLMLPLYEMAMTAEAQDQYGFSIPLNLYDGVVVNFRRGEQSRHKWEPQMIEAVGAVAKQYDIQTRLEGE
jgi:hypothetical protein